MPDAGIIELIKSYMNDPWLEILIVIWALGWVAKTTPFIKNNYVPLVLVVLGMLLGALLIEFSLNGVLAGLVLAVFAIGSHSTVKNTVQRRV
ncbi:hypothetical protein JOC37_002403 [Desulfohalotomaculum tongense]|uniref:phage holin family protein n=1 Tax=Desulforadius tongensis TaxID=1216062 RepID=UPI001959E87A|nr:phage holin family protein [Desulforadius tongensis]MBM7855980.1 hypothetical protein [Desulforadius tongensis]